MFFFVSFCCWFQPCLLGLGLGLGLVFLRFLNVEMLVGGSSGSGAVQNCFGFMAQEKSV